MGAGMFFLDEGLVINDSLVYPFCCQGGEPPNLIQERYLDLRASLTQLALTGV